MPGGREYLYFLVDQQNRSYYVENGMVLFSSTPRPLEHTPEGWEDLDTRNERNSTTFALDRMYSTPLNFVEDGAMILKDQYYRLGLRAKMSLVILKQKLFFDATNYGFYHDGHLRGDVDFITFDDQGEKVTINILEGGITQIIKAFGNSTYEIPMNRPDNEWVKMDGITLVQKATFLVNDGFLQNNLGGSSLSMQLIANESISTLGARNQDRIKSGNSAAALWPTDNWFLETGAEPVPVTIKFKFAVTMSLASGVGPVNPTSAILNLHLLDSASTQTTVKLYEIPTHDPIFLYNNKHIIQGTWTGTIPANKRAIIYLGTTNQREFTFFNYDNDGELTIDYTYRHRDSYIRVLKPLIVLQDIVKQMSKGKYTIQSTFLQTVDNVKMTCGDALRGFENPIMKTSFNDWYQSYNPDFDLAIGIVNGQLRCEQKSFFVDYTAPIKLGSVRNLRVKPAVDLTYNSIKIGAPDQTYEDVNGRQEFNVTTEWTTPIPNVTKELNLVSVYRDDCYGAEFTRINFEGRTTTDAKADGEIWKIVTEKKNYGYLTADSKPVYFLDRSLNVTATGLLQASSVFNLFLTPKRKILRHGRYLHSLFYQMDGEKIEFRTHPKNREVKSGSPLIVEKADVVIGSLLPPYFTANVLEFESPAPVNLTEELDANPVRAFELEYLGIIYKGVAVKVGIRDVDKRPQGYVLYSAPDNDLTKLIKLFE